ncbi:hypothetical protein [Flavobacterium sp.]|uniref:hypothetical protein n=1 Tax=Flavobacterium sp. TaxID=239 RepID=UPI000AB597C1|nr:hypothetical protein [Flavobacterium sp.]
MRIIKTHKSKKDITHTVYKLHQLDWLEYISIGLCLWFVFYPRPYEYLLIGLLLLPFIGMFLNGLNKPSIASLVEIDHDSKDEYDVADFIDLPAWAILVRTLIDYETDSYLTVIVVGTVAFVAICLFLLVTHQQISDSNKDKWWIYGSIVFSFFVYSYSAVIALNCTFDYSEPKEYKTEVIDKHITTRRKGGRTYYVKVKPWGHHYDAESISVSSEEYELYQINDKVEVEYKEGLLGIPWYYLD